MRITNSDDMLAHLIKKLRRETAFECFHSAMSHIFDA